MSKPTNLGAEFEGYIRELVNHGLLIQQVKLDPKTEEITVDRVNQEEFFKPYDTTSNSSSDNNPDAANQ